MTQAERALLIAIAEVLHNQTLSYDLQIAIENLRREEDLPDRRGLSGADVITGPTNLLRPKRDAR